MTPGNEAPGREAPHRACPRCNSAMKFIGTTPERAGAGELLIYYCADCDALEPRAGAKIPSMWR